MSELVEDVQMVDFTHPTTGEEAEAAIVPAGFYVCLISPEKAAKFAEWTEVKAVRIKVDEDTVAALEISDDEEYLTDPEAE